MLITDEYSYRSIDWMKLTCGSEIEDFLDAVQDCFLAQHVDKPACKDSLLDKVMTLGPSLLENLEVREPLGTSDHNIITWDSICYMEIISKMEYMFNYLKAGYDSMKKYLSVIDWDER